MTGVYFTQGAVITILLMCLINTLVVGYRYNKANKIQQRTHGLRSLHVLLIAIGFFGLQGTLAWGLVENLAADRFTAGSITRVSLYGFFSFIIFVALSVISQLQVYRVKFYRENPEMPGD